MKDHPEVLLIEDNEDHAFLISSRLKKTLGCQVEVAGKADEAFKRLEHNHFDLILSDYNLPDESGLTILKELKSKRIDTPFVMITGAGDEKIAVSAMQEGAYNYIVKDEVYLNLLPRVVEETLHKHQMDKENERLQKELAEKNTALEKAYEDLKKLDHLKVEFVASVSHEFRTPLNSIQESISLLEDGFEKMKRNQYERVVTIARNNVKRLSLLIEDLLDFSKYEAGKMRFEKSPHSVSALIQEAMESMQPVVQKKGLELEKKTDEGSLRVFVDRGRIIQVLMNLIDNAIKFTFPGGRITISTRQQDRFLAITVEDTGVGIPPDQLTRIFEKFEQVRTAAPGVEFRGTGLGLAISKEIVESHQGKIWAESKVGEGSRFTFTLPLYD